MKVAIFFPYLCNKGGAERITLLTAKAFNADIYAGLYFPDCTFPEFKTMRVHAFSTKRLGRFSHILMRLRFMFLKVKGHDVHIFHGGVTLPTVRKHKNSIWYCHAPVRWLYDLYDEEKAKFKGPKRLIFTLFASILRCMDKAHVRHFDTIIANSKFTQERIKKYYGRDSVVVFPPVNREDFHFERLGDFFLSAARIDPIKRISTIVKAFTRMPDKKLVVASGGPDLEKIKELAKLYPNITVLGWVSDEKLKELYNGCLATLYMGHAEDFGMCPVESMAAGKPCIAADEGGLRETVVDGETGFLVESTEDAIITAVQTLSPQNAMQMRLACEKRATIFDESLHLQGMRDAMNNL